MVERDVCSTHLRKLGSLPYFSAVQDAAFSSWVSAAAKHSDDTPHLIRAVDSILRTKTLPQSPDDIVDAINATRIHEQAEATHNGGCCGRMVPGWTYLGHDPKAPVTLDEAQLRVEITKYLMPSQCVRGWIHRTIWLPVVPARIYEDGTPVKQPYHFSGKCKCQPGGAL